MHLNKWWARFALALMVFVTALACRTSDVFIAQQPTNTPTRTPRPTFTPPPKSTNTLVPTVPPPPPPTAIPTLVPTKKPTPKPPTPRPPTPVPVVVPTTPPQPPKPSYQYAMAGFRCEHSGGSWLKGHVYSDRNDPNSAVPGVKVAFGGAGGETYGTGVTDDNGDYAFTLTADGGGAKIGTFYIWLTDSSGNRISDMAGPIKINGLPDSAPDSCWAGWAFFTKNY